MEADYMKYIHYWKRQISDSKLQAMIDKYALYSKDVWLILLEEKLRRVELEISIF